MENSWDIVLQNYSYTIGKILEYILHYKFFYHRIVRLYLKFSPDTLKYFQINPNRGCFLSYESKDLLKTSCVHHFLYRLEFLCKLFELNIYINL